MHEDDARKMYLHQMSGAVITRCGLVIYHREPCLACSPDDIVTLATGEQGLVEYKCSYKAVKESLTLQQAAVQLRGFCSTLSDDGQLQLKRMHTYFYQVQGYLAITGKPLCHFVQWTPKGLSIETIQADPGFWVPACRRIIEFYRRAVLPELVLPRYSNGQPIREPFNEIITIVLNVHV